MSVPTEHGLINASSLQKLTEIFQRWDGWGTSYLLCYYYTPHTFNIFCTVTQTMVTYR